MTRDQEVAMAMSVMPENWRHRWCESQMCACMGAANCSGRLTQLGISRTEWDNWIEVNPNPNPPESDEVIHAKILAALQSAHASEQVHGGA